MTQSQQLESLEPILDAGFYAEHGQPHEAWRTLRHEAPVYLYDHPRFEPFWVVTKHADVQYVSKNPQLFSSGDGTNLRRRDRAEIDVEAFRKRVEDSLGADATKGAPQRGMFLNMDPPYHGVYRGMVNKKFTPRALAPLEPFIEDLAKQVAADVAARLVDEAVEKGEVEFVADIAAKLPLVVITQMMGLPKQDWDFIIKILNVFAEGQPPERDYQNENEQQLSAEAMRLFPYFMEQTRARRKNPGDDLISMLVKGEIDGEPMSDFDVVQNCFLFIIAGNETTRNSTSDGMLSLMQHPDQMERLRADPTLLPTAVEEIVRWVSPVVHFARRCTQDTELRGQEIKAGQWLLMFYPSANRDEEIFEDPYRFDVGRTPNPHLGFGGYGEHFCLGANLARLELRVIFGELLEKIARIEPAGTPRRARSTFLPGLLSMPVRLTPA